MKTSYMCYNLIDLCAEINAPLKQTNRIQYTCLDASSNYIVLGASSGSIYIFRRFPKLEFLQLIQNMYGPINHVAISPQEKFVTFSTVKGTICVYVINLTASYPQIVTGHYEDTTVTCLHWKRNEEQLFYGDNKGNVFLVNLTSFLGRNLTNISIHPILFLEVPIVQICDFDKLLLVSNYAKCILCNMESEEFKQIGNTPRDGYYGACFLQSTNKTRILDAKVYCARPGSRLWEATVEGHVIQTSQYKLSPSIHHPIEIFTIDNQNHYSSSIAAATVAAAALRNTTNQLIPIINTNNILDSTNIAAVATTNSLATTTTTTNHTNSNPSSIIHFNNDLNKKTPQILQKLQPIFGKFIFSYTKNGFYIVDPINSEIVLWSDAFRDIETVKIVNGSTLLIFTNKSHLFSVTCRSLEDGFIDMLNMKLLSDCVQLLTTNKNYFKEFCLAQGYISHILKLKSALLHHGNGGGISEDLMNIFNEFTFLEEQYEPPSAIAARKQENGVYMVDNGFSSSGSISFGNIQGSSNQKNLNGLPRMIDENLKTVLISASRNIFNKFFNDQQPQQNDNVIVSNKHQQQQQQLHRRHKSSQSTNVIPYQNVDTLVDQDENIVVTGVTSRRNRRSNQSNRNLNHNLQSQQQQQQQQQQQRHRNAISGSSTNNSSSITSQIIDQNLLLLSQRQISPEEKLLQNLFMIYKSSRISNLSLVDRYASTFDEYDPQSIRNLLFKLADIMKKNDIPETLAAVHCYEMYFNYLNADLLWEFDEDSIDYVVSGFVLVNQSGIDDDNETIRCGDCRFPLFLKPPRYKYKTIGETIFKYFWSRNQHNRCYELVRRVPWTIEFICKIFLKLDSARIEQQQQYQLQQQQQQQQHSYHHHHQQIQHQQQQQLYQHHRQFQQIVRLLFACGNAEFFLKAIECDWFTLAVWEHCFQIMVELHDDNRQNHQLPPNREEHEIFCAICDRPTAIVPSETFLSTLEFYSWSYFLNCLVKRLNGRKSIELIKKYGDRISNNAIPKDFYLKCLFKK